MCTKLMFTSNDIKYLQSIKLYIAYLFIIMDVCISAMFNLEFGYLQSAIFAEIMKGYQKKSKKKSL